MTIIERVAQASSALKVFPLPGAVLFPHTVLPLNIFEPRYVELVRDSLAGDRVMAISQLAPGWENDYYGRPPLVPILCAAVIAWHEHHDDGRYTVLLQGVSRARLLGELPSRKLYREVEAELLPDANEDLPEGELVRQASLELASRMPGLADEFLQVVAKTRGGALADVVAGAIVEDVQKRQQLLDELDVRKRLGKVLDEVSGFIAALAPTRPTTGPLN